MSWEYRVVKKGSFRVWYEIYLIGNGEAFSFLGDNNFESLEAISERITALQKARELPVLEVRDGKLVEVESVQPVLPDPPDLWRCTECGGVFDEEECRVDEWPDHACPQCGVMLVPVRNEMDIEKYANRRADLAADEEGR